MMQTCAQACVQACREPSHVGRAAARKLSDVYGLHHGKAWSITHGKVMGELRQVLPTVKPSRPPAPKPEKKKNSFVQTPPASHWGDAKRVVLDHEDSHSDCLPHDMAPWTRRINGARHCYARRWPRHYYAEAGHATVTPRQDKAPRIGGLMARRTDRWHRDDYFAEAGHTTITPRQATLLCTLLLRWRRPHHHCAEQATPLLRRGRPRHY